MVSKEEKGVLGGYCDKGDLAVCDMGNLGDMAYLDY